MKDEGFQESRKWAKEKLSSLSLTYLIDHLWRRSNYVLYTLKLGKNKLLIQVRRLQQQID